MYFVVIDVNQLYTRLRNVRANQALNLGHWLACHGFAPTAGGWYGSADSMNSLSCSEIVFSEWRRPHHGEASSNAARVHHAVA